MKAIRVRIAVLAAAGALLLGACSGGGHGGGFDATRPGQTIPVTDRKPPGDVGGPLLSSSGTYSLSQDSGKITVVNLWGAWCEPCQVETPQFDSLYRTLKPRGVDFVGFDVKETSKGEPTSFVTANHISYPIVWDPKAQVALQLGNLPLAGLPDTAVIDRHGRIAGVFIGELQPADLNQTLSTLLAES